MKYSVILIPSDEGFAVTCPALPGCWSQGKTQEEALANIRNFHPTLAGSCGRRRAQRSRP